MHRYVLLFYPLLTGSIGVFLVCARASAACTTRRCLAQALIDRKLLSQPQTDQCKQTLKVPFIEYQTLSVVSFTLYVFYVLYPKTAEYQPF